MRLLTPLLLAAAFLMPAASSDTSPSTAALGVPRVGEGWFTAAVDAPGGFSASIRVEDADLGRFGLGMIAYAPDGSVIHRIVYASDGRDAYATQRAFNVAQWFHPDGGSTMIVTLDCGRCKGTVRIVYWFSGDAADWTPQLQGAVATATGAGPEVYLLMTEDFADVEGPLGSGFAAVAASRTFEAEHNLILAMPSWASSFTGGIMVPTLYSVAFAAPDGSSSLCTGACEFFALEGPGTYTLDASAVGIGFDHTPLLFTGADARLP